MKALTDDMRYVANMEYRLPHPPARAGMAELLWALPICCHWMYGSLPYGSPSSPCSRLGLTDCTAHAHRYVEVDHPPCSIVEIAETQESFAKMKGGRCTFGVRWAGPL